MAATPRYGTLMARGASGTTYAIDIYVSDVANASVNFDNGNGASSTSLTYWKAPENCIIYDLSLASGLADTTNMVLTSDGSQIPKIAIRYANFLNSLATRPTLQVGIRAGSQLGAIQRA